LSKESAPNLQWVESGGKANLLDVALWLDDAGLFDILRSHLDDKKKEDQEARCKTIARFVLGTDRHASKIKKIVFMDGHGRIIFGIPLALWKLELEKLEKERKRELSNDEKEVLKDKVRQIFREVTLQVVELDKSVHEWHTFTWQNIVNLTFVEGNILDSNGILKDDYTDPQVLFYYNFMGLGKSKSTLASLLKGSQRPAMLSFDTGRKAAPNYKLFSKEDVIEIEKREFDGSPLKVVWLNIEEGRLKFPTLVILTEASYEDSKEGFELFEERLKRVNVGKFVLDTVEGLASTSTAGGPAKNRPDGLNGFKNRRMLFRRKFEISCLYYHALAWYLLGIVDVIICIVECWYFD
jgi:hypothetical protein